MSDDESPTGGHHKHQYQQQQQQPSTAADYDANSSIIGKVRSRVSSILPEKLTKWFSPTTGANDGSQNGNIRRRRDRNRDEILDRDGDDDSENTEDSDIEEDEDENVAPPLKRIKRNPEEQQIAENYQIKNQNSNRHFVSSTPTIRSRHRHLDISSNQREISHNFGSATTSTIVRNRTACLNNDEMDSTDVTDIAQDKREFEWGESRHISSRRSLNIPSSSSTLSRRLPDLRRQSLKRVHNVLDSPRTAHSILVERDLEDEEQDVARSDNEEKTADIIIASKSRKSDESSDLINGVEATTNIVVQVDDASESGDSQCSSVQRRKHSGIYTAPKTLRSTMGSMLNFYTHLEGKKSLFSDKNMPNYLNNSTMSLTSLNRRQSFNASLYGSTSALSDSRILNTTSPFYKGRTTYGGASAYSKFSQQTSRTLHTPTLIRPTSSLSSLSTSNNSLAQSSDAAAPAISNTAKRILELMNQFTSPLTDAKKMANNIKVPALIAHKKRFGESDLQANRAIRLSSPRTPYSRAPKYTESSSKQPGPPINELQVPSMSQLLQMKKLQNNTECVREIANSSKSILNLGEEYKLPSETQNIENSSNKHISKVKNKVSSKRLNKKSVMDEQETLPTVNLPDIPLPFMKSVPKIDIPISSTSTVLPAITTPFKKSAADVRGSEGNNNVSSPVRTSTTIASSFTISSGNALNSSSINNPQQQQNSKLSIPSLARNNSSTIVNINLSNTEGVEFKFSTPISVNTTYKSNIEPINNFKFSAPVPISATSSSTSTKLDNFKYESTIKEKPTKDGLKTIENNTTTNSNVGLQLKSGSVLDALQKPITTTENPKDSKQTLSIAEQFKTTNKWECSVCMIRNDNSRDKCEACEAPKPGQKPSVSTQNKPLVTTNMFGNVFKSQTDTWECPVCMIRNKNDILNCLACSASKPGGASISSQSSAPTAKTTVTSVPKPMDSCFKNIAAEQASKWECSVCMTRNEQNRTKCVCCEQVKPGSANESAPKFSFGESGSKFSFGFGSHKEDELKKMQEEKTKTTPSVTLAETKTTGFTFGIPTAPSAATTTASITFGFTPIAKSTVASGKDVTDAGKGGFKFSAPATQSKEDNKQKTGFNFASTSTISAPENKVENKEQKSEGFGFGSPPIKSKEDSGQKSSEQLSAFKPAGRSLFGSVTSNANVTKSTTESINKPATFSFGSPASTSTETVKTSVTSEPKSTQKPDSTAEVKSLFKFGAAAPSEKKSTDEKPTFGFGSAASIPAPPVFGSQLQKKDSGSTGLFSATPSTSTTSNPISTQSFVFGKPTTLSTSATPLFGAVSSSTASSKTATSISSTPTFGSIATGASTTTTSLFGAAVSSSSLANAVPTFGTSLQQQQQPQSQQTSSFGNSFSASTNNSQQNNNNNNNQSNNLFTFGAAAKTEPSKSVFGSVSSTTNKSFSFGSGTSTLAAAAAAAQPPSPFAFGAGSAQKSIEPTSVFGSATSNTNSAAGNSALPTFGSFSSPTLNTQQQQQQQSQPTGAFGQPAPTAASNTTQFGSGNSGTFGAAPSAGSIFGSSAPSFGNPIPSFGSTTNTTFGSSTAVPTFGSGFSSDAPAAKKSEPAFNFGASTQNTSAAPFQFGANNNNNKPAFNFSATAAPSFNFTGSQEATNASQPFHFGAASTAPGGVFNFSGVETAPNAPFQFSAAPAANNIFAPTPGTPSSSSQTAAARRKIKSAPTRRSQPRQAS